MIVILSQNVVANVRFTCTNHLLLILTEKINPAKKLSHTGNATSCILLTQILMKKVLITGANGFLGQHLYLYLTSLQYNVMATGRGQCRITQDAVNYTPTDLTDKEAIARLVAEYQPNVIIHNAAMSKPDECDNNRELSVQTNVESTRLLLSHACGHFIYISTDFIFGENGPHYEDEQPGPLNFYGETKLMAEKLVKASGKPYSIVRPVFIYGKQHEGMRPSFLHWVRDNLAAGKRIKVTSDQLRTPTYAVDICKGIHRIIDLEATGDFHLAGQDILSPYDMAMKVAEVLGLDGRLIEKVTAETFPEPVKLMPRTLAMLMTEDCARRVTNFGQLPKNGIAPG